VNHRVRWVVALALGTATAAAAPPPVVRVFVAGTPEAVAGTRDALRDRCARPELVILVEDAGAVVIEPPEPNGDAATGNGADAAANGASTWGDDSSWSETAHAENGADTPSHEALLLGSGQATDLAVGYVALETAAESRVVLVDGRTHQELERRVLEPTESLEMSIETVANVICATIDSALATRAAPLRAPVPPPAPPPVVTNPPPRAPLEAESAYGVWAGVFGTGADYGAGFRGGGGGFLGATTGSGRVRASLLLLASDFPSLSLDRQGAEPSFGLFGARLLPGAALRVADDIDALVGVGPGIDWLRVTPGTPPPGGTAETGVGSVDPVLSALLGARLRVGGHVGLWLAMGADLDADRHRYLNVASGTPVTFFEMPRLRANGQAGLAVTFGRDGAAAEHASPGVQTGSLP